MPARTSSLLLVPALLLVLSLEDFLPLELFLSLLLLDFAFEEEEDLALAKDVFVFGASSSMMSSRASKSAIPPGLGFGLGTLRGIRPPERPPPDDWPLRGALREGAPDRFDSPLMIVLRADPERRDLCRSPLLGLLLCRFNG